MSKPILSGTVTEIDPKDFDEELKKIEKEYGKSDQRKEFQKDLIELTKQQDLEISEEDRELAFESKDYMLRLYRDKDSFADYKEFGAYIKKIESGIRRSPEYADWRDFVKDDLGNNTCVFTNETSEYVTVELHHHPIQLFDICRIVALDFFDKGKSITSLVIANEVIKLHYKNVIGYVPLVTTLHEKYHSGLLLIPMDYVWGDWKEFMQRYEKIINEEVALKDYIEGKLEIKLQEGDSDFTTWQTAELKKFTKDVA